jgi:hypothetical protein
VDPRVGLDDVEKILDPTGTGNTDPSVVQPVASHYSDCAIPAHIFMEIFSKIWNTFFSPTKAFHSSSLMHSFMHFPLCTWQMQLGILMGSASPLYLGDSGA